MTASWSSEMWAEFAAAVLPVLTPDVGPEHGAERADSQPQVPSLLPTCSSLPTI
jgi:hypothetical protein